MPTTMTALATVPDPRGRARVDAMTGTGFTITFDIAEDGAERGGPSPTESILAALAACTSMDVGSILRKKRQSPASYRIAVTGEKTDEHPQVYTGIVVEHQGGEPDDQHAKRDGERVGPHAANHDGMDQAHRQPPTARLRTCPQR